jgi:hypothetical protein
MQDQSKVSAMSSPFHFENPWGPPVDPAYTAFESGWAEWIANGGVFRFPAIRWHPARANWFLYPAPRWEMIDRAVPDLAPPPAVLGFTLPQTFTAVRAESQRYPQFPNLVWNPFNGEWREVRDTAAVPAKPPVPPPTLPTASVDAAKAKAIGDREREMNEVYAEYAAGAIDILTLNSRIADITARYAPLLG